MNASEHLVKMQPHLKMNSGGFNEIAKEGLIFGFVMIPESKYKEEMLGNLLK